jgi:muramoyltetrapeptide carboxypeptidase
MSKKSQLKKSPLLSVGDTVGIVAPASYLPKGEKKYLLQAMEKLTAMGFKVKYTSSLEHKKHLYLAGGDEERAHDLMETFLDPEIKAILCSRGGYGTLLLIYLLQMSFVIPFHGPNVATRQFVEGDVGMERSLKRALISNSPLDEIECCTLRNGEAQGEIVGGCLSSLMTTIGTSYEINLMNKILFVEDVREPPYKIDRMLTHLKEAGKLRGVRGIIFGQMPGCDSGDRLLQKMILDVLKDVDGPLLFGFPSGHGSLNITIPLGVKVLVKEGMVTFKEGGVE